jgi:hypothetical protein
LAQQFVIFNDAIVHHRNFRNLTGKMRVRVALGRRAVGSPTGVGNTDFTAEILFVRKFAEFGDPPGSAQSMQSAIHQRNPGGIITAVFETAQTFQQSGNYITSGYRTDYSAH